jgi:hypothetical protein
VPNLFDPVIGLMFQRRFSADIRIDPRLGYLQFSDVALNPYYFMLVSQAPHFSAVRGAFMYLMVGNEQDPCVFAVRSALERRGKTVVTGLNPFGSVAHLRWRFDTRHSSPEYVLANHSDEVRGVLEHSLEGVFVRSFAALLDPTGWTPTDASYLHSEGMAALLAWLHALPCPVVGRPSDDAWYRVQRPLPEWVGVLAACGLDTPEVVVTNAADAERFAWSGRAVYQPLTSNRQYAIQGAAWSELVKVMEYVPVCLAEPLDGPVHAVTLVGNRTFWTNPPSRDLERLSAGVGRVAAHLGSDFVQLIYAAQPDGLKFTSVNLQPSLELHEAADQQAMADEIARRLCGPDISHRAIAAHQNAEVKG